MKKILIIAALAVSAAGLQAGDAPFFQASLTPDIAIHTKTTEIRGISLNIWGENPQTGLALGFVNGSTGDSGGVMWGWVNYSQDSYVGWQNSIVNFSKGKFTGLQSGMVNYAQECHGLQWGMVNYAEKLDGVQIGFANIAINNGWFDEFPSKLAKGFVFVNWSF